MAKSKYCFTKVPHLTDDGHDRNQWRMGLVMENIPGYSFGNTTAKPIIGSAEYVDKIVDLYNKVLEVDFKRQQEIVISTMGYGG